MPKSLSANRTGRERKKIARTRITEWKMYPRKIETWQIPVFISSYIIFVSFFFLSDACTAVHHRRLWCVHASPSPHFRLYARKKCNIKVFYYLSFVVNGGIFTIPLAKGDVQCRSVEKKGNALAHTKPKRKISRVFDESIYSHASQTADFRLMSALHLSALCVMFHFFFFFSWVL